MFERSSNLVGAAASARWFKYKKKEGLLALGFLLCRTERPRLKAHLLLSLYQRAPTEGLIQRPSQPFLSAFIAPAITRGINKGNNPKCSYVAWK